MKDFIARFIALTFGSTLASFAARLMIAAIALYTGSATNIGDAIGIAVDKERSVAVAAAIINATPKAEVKKAVAAEDVQLVKQAIEVK